MNQGNKLSLGDLNEALMSVLEDVKAAVSSAPLVFYAPGFWNRLLGRRVTIEGPTPYCRVSVYEIRFLGRRTKLRRKSSGHPFSNDVLPWAPERLALAQQRLQEVLANSSKKGVALHYTGPETQRAEVVVWVPRWAMEPLLRALNAVLLRDRPEQAVEGEGAFR